MPNFDLQPDAPESHRFLAESWPFIARTCFEESRCFGIEAADLEHDVTVSILANFDSVVVQRGVDREAFLKVTVWRVVKSRWLKRWSRLTRCAELELVVNVYLAADVDPAETAERDDLLRELVKRLGILSRRQREAIRLRFGLDGYEQLKGRALVAAMGMPETSVSPYVALMSGLRKLAVVLGADPDRSGTNSGE